MKYEIKGGSFPVVICNLENGEKMITEKGSMAWMSPNMQMETHGGGLGRMFSKAFSGESIDGLASLVQQQFDLDPFTNTLFLFCGRRRDRIKALYWEGNGFILLYKRLESGSFQWPRKESEARALTSQQYRWLMEGLSVDQPKAHRAVTGLEIV